MTLGESEFPGLAGWDATGFQEIIIVFAN